MKNGISKKIENYLYLRVNYINNYVYILNSLYISFKSTTFK